MKSLLPFKCLRKSWCSLFSDPQFIRVHFNVAITDNYVKHLRQRLLFSHPLIITQSTVVDHEARNDAIAVELAYSLKNRGFYDFTLS